MCKKFNSRPLYVSGEDERPQTIENLLRKPYDIQADIIAGVSSFSDFDKFGTPIRIDKNLKNIYYMIIIQYNHLAEEEEMYCR